ncbi:MAG: MFS transporter, partial [Cyanobacteria bacterium REEB65]|nr:MFS transporter [Cyanobacteria bacterium REEB65]
MDQPQTPTRILELDVPGRVRGYSHLLKNHAFLSLWIAQVLSQVADKIYFILMVDLVTALTHNNGSWTSAALVAYTVPSVLFGAIAGALVDRWNKVRAQWVTNLMRGGLIAIVPWVAQHHAWPVVVVSFLISTFSQPYTPAEAATIPLVVHGDDLLAANSLFATTVVGSIILGFTLGEPAIELAGGAQVGASAWFIAAMYGISTLALLFVRTPPQPRRDHPIGEIYAEYAQSIAYIRANREVWGAIVRLVVLFAMFAALSTVAILFAKQALQTNFSWLLATAGCGMAVGAGVIGRWGQRWERNTMVNGGFLGAGIALVILALFGSEPYSRGVQWILTKAHLPVLAWANNPALITGLAYVLTGMVGFSAAWVAIPNQTLLQEVVP